MTKTQITNHVFFLEYVYIQRIQVNLSYDELIPFYTIGYGRLRDIIR